jgi:hypothetical protein
VLHSVEPANSPPERPLAVRERLEILVQARFAKLLALAKRSGAYAGPDALDPQPVVNQLRAEQIVLGQRADRLPNMTSVRTDSSTSMSAASGSKPSARMRGIASWTPSSVAQRAS